MYVYDSVDASLRQKLIVQLELELGATSDLAISSHKRIFFLAVVSSFRSLLATASFHFSA